MARDILASSLQNASFNIIFQLLCRCVTFVINAVVVRHVGHAVLGVMNVRLLLLESMILFLSREPFMRACLTNAADHNWAQVVNLLWLTVPICCAMSLLFGYVWLYLLSSTELLPPYYTFAVFAVAAACTIELTSLVVQLVSSAFLFVRLKIVLDTARIVFRTVTFVPLILYRPENALLSFGIAQLVSAGFYTASHYAYFHYYIKTSKKTERMTKMSVRNGTDKLASQEFPFGSVRDFLPGQLRNNDSCFDEKLTILTRSFFRQGILKQILTEGERLIMTILPVLTFAEQGAYEVVNNLGSLAARFIFRPIEDSSYFYFTQTVKRDESLSAQNPTKIRESVKVLTDLLSTVAFIGLVVFVFGQSYSSTLLWLYGGSNLATELPVQLLRAHCLAVLLLGINGVTECYASATADSRTINKGNLIMIYQSVGFLGASYLLVTWFGPVGFIFGNCFNMTLRIVHATVFINRRHIETVYRPLRGLIPTPLFTGTLIVSALVTNSSQAYLFPDLKLSHLLVGISMLVVVTISWLYEHYEQNGLVKLAAIKLYEMRNGRNTATVSSKKAD